MQAIHRTRMLRMLSLTMVLAAACSGSADEAVETTTVAPTTTTQATTSTAPSTTTTTTNAPRTTSTTTTTAVPAPTTTEPATIPERSLTVAAASPPTVDGVIDPGEWDSATATTMSNGDTVYWQHTDATLYVALDGNSIGAVNLVLADADALWILHSSAALGSQLFTPGDAGWEQVHGYSWCCRSPNNDAARLALFDDEGWQANIGFTGDTGVIEYQVALPWGFANAALIYHTEDQDSAYWPDDLASAAAEHITQNMWTDPGLDSAAWMMLVPGS